MDPSTLQRPSIIPHVQNRYHEAWTQLFDLIWRGWVYVDATDAEASRQQVQELRRIQYLGFQRLALAAMQHSPHFTPEERLEALFDG